MDKISATSLSVVIPAYQAEGSIGKAMDSILAWDIPDLQLLVVDDGSTDGTLEVLKRYASADKRVQVIQQKNQGRSAARNVGLDAVNGEWVMFADADDEYDRHSSARIISAIDAGVDLAVWSFGHGGNANESEIIISSKRMFRQTIDQFTDPFHRKAPFNIEIGSVWGRLYRRRYISDIRFIEGLKYSEDRLFNVECLARMAKHGASVLLSSFQIYNWGANGIGTCHSFSQRDILEIRNYSEALQQLAVTGVIQPSDAGTLLSEELLYQFVRDGKYSNTLCRDSVQWASLMKEKRYYTAAENMPSYSLGMALHVGPAKSLLKHGRLGAYLALYMEHSIQRIIKRIK